jgi:dienelactone hydrolase
MSREPQLESSRDREDAQVARLITTVVAVVALVVGVLLGLGAFSSRAAAQGAPPAPTQYAYVMTKGTDTLIVERVTMGRSGANVELALGGQATLRFIADQPTPTRVSGLSFSVVGPGAAADATPLQKGAMRFTADSVFLEVNAGGRDQKVARPTTGDPLPIINNDFVLIDAFVQRARASKQPTYTGQMFAMTGAVLLPTTVEFVGADSATFAISGQVNRLALDASGHVRGAMIPTQGVLVTRVDGAAAAKISLGKPNYGVPADAPYTAEEVTVKTPMGHVLTGTLTIPKGASGKVGAVVTITGSGQEDRDEYISLVPGYRIFRQVADTLGRRGVAVLRMDDRGINGSGGDLVKATSADFADDIRAGIAYLRTRSEIDGARIALVGHSEGGMIGPMVAASDPKVKAVVLMAGPAYTGQKIIDFQLKNLVENNKEIPADKKDSILTAARVPFGKDANAWTKYFLTYDPIPTLKKVKQPVLILQGGTDQQITPEQAPIIERTLKGAGNTDVTLKLFPERNHLFLKDPIGFPSDYVKLKNGKIDPEVMGALAEWVVAKVGGK